MTGLSPGPVPRTPEQAPSGLIMFVQEVPGVSPVRPTAWADVKVLWIGSVGWKPPMLSGDLRLVIPAVAS